MFHGKAPLEFSVGNEFKPPIHIVSDHPVAMLFANLLHLFRKGSEILGKMTTEEMMDSRGKPFPDNFSISVETPKVNRTSLRAQTIELVDRLGTFIRENPELKPVREAAESGEDFVTRALMYAAEFRGQQAAKFRLQLEQEVRRVSDEIEANYGGSNLSPTIQKATRSCDPATIQEIRDELWTLAGKMEK